MGGGERVTEGKHLENSKKKRNRVCLGIARGIFWGAGTEEIHHHFRGKGKRRESG